MLLEEYNFKREVLDDPGPVLVEFWAEWCPPCRMMNPIVESLAKRFKVCKVNLDTNQPLAVRFRVEAVPTFLIFKGGQVVKRYQGVTLDATLRAELEAIPSEPEA